MGSWPRVGGNATAGCFTFYPPRSGYTVPAARASHHTSNDPLIAGHQITHSDFLFWFTYWKLLHLKWTSPPFTPLKTKMLLEFQDNNAYIALGLGLRCLYLAFWQFNSIKKKSLMIIINSMTTPLKRLLYSKYKERDTYTENPRKLSISTNEKVKATSYLEKVRAFYVMWVKKQFDSSHSLTMFLSVLIFWLNEVHEDEGQTEIPTRSHIKSISNYRRTEKQRKQGTRTESMCFHFTSAQFNSIHNFSST